MKRCRKCQRDLPLSEYYPHPKMADGHLNKCKSCQKAASTARIEQKMKDPDWVVAEAERCRLKQQRRRDEGRDKISPSARSAVLKRHKEKYPEKKIARDAVNNAIRDGRLVKKPCEVCGSNDSEAHHDDYSKPLDVKWLCSKHHAARHVQLNDERRRKKALAA